MFTGIIEEIGSIKDIRTDNSACVLTVSAKKIIEDMNIGDSIAVNGTCLTVCNFNKCEFSADVMPETMRRTNLGKLVKGNKVNLERAMPINGRFGGHIVSGHIDSTGIVKSIKQKINAVWIEISTSKEIHKYIVEKGSIAIDGTSLTVAKVSNNSFSVSMIPHTAKETTLLYHKPGDTVNLECDIIAKYIEKLCKKDSDDISINFLAKHGFI